MQKFTKRALSLALAFVLCFGLVSGIGLEASAATVNYVTGNPSSEYQNVIKNWGTRGTEATFLSPNAIEFYSDNNITYEDLAILSGSSNTSSVPSSALYQKLNQLVTENQTKITSYDDTKDLFQYTDCQGSGLVSNKISCFYSGAAIGPAWGEGNWNREHTWPNSKGDANGQGENDIMMLRPTSSSINSGRGNKAYGEVASTTYYNPNQDAKGQYDLRGDVARIMLYVYTRWGTQNMWGASGVIESKEVLLKWMQEDPVDTWEMGRNDSAESITGTRNVYVDYPELAFVLFNEEVPADMTTPSGKASGAPTVDLSSGVSVMGHNVYFNEFLQIMYAIYVPEGKTIDKVELTDGKVTFEAVPYTATPTIGDKTCVSYVASQGVAMQAIGTEVTAKVYVDGKIVAQDRYSVLEYLHKRLSVDTNVTTVQKTMYQSLLKYAASAQKVLKPADTSINNYTYIHVNNGTYKGYATGMYLQGGTIALSDLAAEGTVLSWNYQIIGGESGTLIDTLTIGAQDVILTAVIDDSQPEEPEPTVPETEPTEPSVPVEPTNGNRYYIATKRTSGNYYYMTSNLGSADTKRYTAVDSGLSTLPAAITVPETGYVFVLEENTDGTYYIYAEGAGENKYLGWTSGNSGTLVAKESAKKVTVDIKSDGIYNIHFAASDAERYLALNGTSGNDYFAWYKSGQKQELTLIPVGSGSGETPTEPTVPEESVPEETTAPTVPETEPTEPESTTPVKVATFDLGADGTASHSDGSSTTTYSETNNGYTLSVSGGSQFYKNARDAKGNSCLKLGSSKNVGTCTITVPEDVTKVVIYVAKYKANATKVMINETEYTLSQSSDNGQYDAIEIDTTTQKTITLTTLKSYLRAMVNTIEFYK